jgi:hypothetical protein
VSDETIPPAAKKLFFFFIATLFLYVTIYGACQAMRVKGGPWNLTYALGEDQVPELRIEHPKRLGSLPVILRFPGETPERTDLPITAVFSSPITNNMPFGPVLFVDTTLLPGTVAVNCFGHVIELVPRTLFLNFQEVPWVAGTQMVLSQESKPDEARIQAAQQQWKGR